MPLLDWSQCPAVESIPGKVSGAWVLRNTRMPVATIFENLEAGANIDDIMAWYDGLDRDQVKAVIEFAASQILPNANSGSRGLQQRRSHGRGHFDGDESIGREQVVLAALIDDAKVSVPLGVMVGQNGIDLVALEGRLVPVVADADDESSLADDRPPSSSRGTSCA